MKKNLAVVLGATNNMAFAVAVVIQSIKKYSPYLNGDFIIYHNGISSKDKNILNTIANCTFVDYQFRGKNADLDEIKYFNTFTKLAYSRFECFDLLNNYKNVIWLDTDTLVLQDISHVLNLNKTGFAGIYNDKNKFKVYDDFHEIKPVKYENFCSLNSGVLFLNDKIKNYDKITGWCYNKTLKYKTQDQGIINIMVQEFGISITELDKIYNNPVFSDKTNAYILHSVHSKKFWNFWNDKRWSQLYNNWLKMGGSKYAGKRINMLEREWIINYGDVPYPLRHPKKFLKHLVQKH